MRIRTLLNNCHYLKSFVYKKEGLESVNGEQALVVEIAARKNSRPVCSGCGTISPGYDLAAQTRLYQFIPLWGYPVYFRYRKRRVDCTNCGIKTEHVPWAEGKEQLATVYQQYLAMWAKRLSWQEVARSFKTSWDHVYKSVKRVVEYGLQQRSLTGIQAIGVDEIQYGKGHQYLTLVYQLDAGRKRLLSIAPKRSVKSLLRCLRELGREGCEGIEYVCSDMWKPYLKVIRKKLPQALHILDRFHIVAMLNKAVDEVRRDEVKSLKAQGYDEAVLRKTKYCLLKNQDNLTDKQQLKLTDILQYDLKSVKAYLLKESFQLFWNYTSPYWAQWYLKKWCYRAMRSKLAPIKKFVKTLRRHEDLMMNWFKARKAYSSGTVEGLNRKVNLVTRKAYGYKNYEVLRIALFHTMGHLPEPIMTHRFL
jgi:transposase